MKQTYTNLKLKRSWPYILLVLSLVIGLSSCQSVGQGQEGSGSQTTAVLSTGDIRISAFGSGTLSSAVEMELEFEYGGMIENILVETGDFVMEGDVLALLEDEDLQEALEDAETELREVTSDASVASALLELAEAQKSVLTAESTLSFYISPYVFKSEVRLQGAQDVLSIALKEAEENPSDEADQRIVEAQETVDNAELSLALNWETYYEEYVPDFFNFRWRDHYFDFWHDYYAPPSELEVAVVWAELASAEARVEEWETYLDALVGSEIPDDAYGSQLVKLEKAQEAVSEAREKLEAALLIAPMDGVVLEIKKEELDQIGTGTFITLALLDPPTLEAWFDEGDWSMVKIGNPVEVIFDALSEKVYQGEIVFVDPTLQTKQNTTVVSALVELDTAETGWAELPLLSAATVEVIAGEAQNTILLPVEGLREDKGDQGMVYLVRDDGEQIPQEVKIGLRDVLYVEITGGLSIGDVVLIGNFE